MSFSPRIFWVPIYQGLKTLHHGGVDYGGRHHEVENMKKQKNTNTKQNKSQTIVLINVDGGKFFYRMSKSFDFSWNEFLAL